jgi:hypothetical protein
MRPRSLLTLASALLISLVVGVSGAQALVVTDAGTQAGIAPVPVPGMTATIASAPGITVATSPLPCADPALSPDLTPPDAGLCFHGGAVMPSNETFDLTWDPRRRDWATTRFYVEQFLRDVADGSGTLSSPYAVTSQYTGVGGRAANASVYGGGCIDYGVRGGSACQFGNTTGTGPGSDYGSNGCTPTGTNQFFESLGGGFGSASNDFCLTDAQLRSELTRMIGQEGVLSASHNPLFVLMTPPGVVTCLDSAGNLCSANGGSTAQFCSYHSQVSVNGTEVAYVVQPWTAQTACDESDIPTLSENPPDPNLATNIGARLVSPLSQAQIGTIVDPGLNAWYASNGAEINDNACRPLGNGLDSVTVGASGQNPYDLQREFNNAGLIESDPNAPSCAPNVVLSPAFVVPSAVNHGDVVEFDGSKTISSLIVPSAQYTWSFGDGTTAVGPSVVHAYANGGSFSVTLNVKDRGGYTASLTQTIVVLGPPATTTPPPPPTTTLPPPPKTTPPPPPKSSKKFKVRIQILPQSLKAMLRGGMTLRLSSNENASGIATLSIPRSAAKKAHIASGRAASVVIGRGTMSQIKSGTMKLHLGLSRATAAKLKRLGHVTMTVRLALVGSDGSHVAIVAAGRY